MRLRFTDITDFVSSYHIEAGRRKEEGGIENGELKIENAPWQW
jgi:hypothetical protein